MPVVTVRNLPEETHRALKLRAAQHGRSLRAKSGKFWWSALRGVRSRYRARSGAN